ncbi:PHP domain-containing protein [Candidatus Woesearchaeota archaeon]|nr:PHP domain-containing protein [Candidatus Woesearchaeota archaeon]
MSESYIKEVNVLKGPIFKLLKKEGYQAVDMHYHSCFSVDGLSKIPPILKKCETEGIGTSFTDHNHIGGTIQACKLAKNKVFVIPGIELTCHNGVHILLHFSKLNEYLHFYNKEMKQKLVKNPWFLDINHNEVVDTASNYNCLITAPHPFGPGAIGIQKFPLNYSTLKKIHAVEVINGCCEGQMNSKALAWAKSLHKGFTGGSDGHCLAEHGTAFTICHAETVEEFLEQIRKNKSLVIGKEEKILDDAIHSLEKFMREEEKAPSKQLEHMWIDRGLLEWNYLKEKIKSSHFLPHFNSHHQELDKHKLSQHRHTKHLVK